MAFHFAGRQEAFNPVDLGLNSVALSATTNSNGFGCEGFNQLTIELEIVRTTTTAVTFFLQQRAQGSTVWKNKMLIVSTDGAGVDTYNINQISIPISVSATYGFVVELPINTGEMRIQSLTGTGGAATDLATVLVRLGCV